MKPRTAPLTERAVIGIVLAYPELITSTDLKAEDFYDDRHKVIWQALSESEKQLDLSSVISVLEARSKLSLAGGVLYLNSLTETVQNPSLNPGKIIGLTSGTNPPPMDSNLRYGSAYRTHTWDTILSFDAQAGLDGAVEQCNGAGVCRNRRKGSCALHSRRPKKRFIAPEVGQIC